MEQEAEILQDWEDEGEGEALSAGRAVRKLELAAGALCERATDTGLLAVWRGKHMCK